MTAFEKLQDRLEDHFGDRLLSFYRVVAPSGVETNRVRAVVVAGDRKAYMQVHLLDESAEEYIEKAAEWIIDADPLDRTIEGRCKPLPARPYLNPALDEPISPSLRQAVKEAVHSYLET